MPLVLCFELQYYEIMCDHHLFHSILVLTSHVVFWVRLLFISTLVLQLNNGFAQINIDVRKANKMILISYRVHFVS